MFDHPTKEEFIEICRSFPFERFDVDASRFCEVGEVGEVGELIKSLELSPWLATLVTSWGHVMRSWVMMIFFFNKGIPDEKYVMSPGPKGESVRYFPDFKREDFDVLNDFTFYADIFVVKIFSVLDVMWQTLNVYFDCGLETSEVSDVKLLKAFKRQDKCIKRILKRIQICDSVSRKAMEQFTRSNKHMESLLKSLKKDERYKRGKEWRKSTVHHWPTGSQQSPVRRQGNSTIIGIMDRTPSSETVEIAKGLVEFTIDTYEKIKEITRDHNKGNDET